MIERHIYIRLKEAGRAQAAEEVVRAVALLAQLPAVSGVRTMHAADEAAAGAWDLLLILSCPTVEAMHGFQNSAAYQSFAEDVLEAHSIVVKAWNLTPVSTGNDGGE